MAARRRLVGALSAVAGGRELREVMGEVVRVLGETGDEGALAGGAWGEVVGALRGVATDGTAVTGLGEAYDTVLALAGGVRKNAGAYYTPAELAEAVLGAALGPVLAEAVSRGAEAVLGLRVCDPACGTGHFLVPAARQLAAGLCAARGEAGEGAGGAMRGALREVVARCVAGSDIDGVAAAICRARLWALTGEGDAAPGWLAERVVVRDSLAGAWESADVVVTNPPWVSYLGRQAGAHGEAEVRALVGRYPEVARWPCLHSAFLLLGVRMLRRGGRIGILLPRQVADLESFGAVRGAVDAVAALAGAVRDAGERAFAGVRHPVALYTLVRREAAVLGNEEAWPVVPWREVAVGETLDVEVLGALERVGRREGFAAGTFVDIGVHTGNVAREVIVPWEEACARGWPGILEGRDIEAFWCDVARKVLNVGFVAGEGQYWRVRPLARYAAVPVVVRQTASRPVAACVRERGYFRNSLLGCMGVAGVADAVVAAFLNSGVYARLHRGAFADAGQAVFPQVKVRHLHALPGVPREGLGRAWGGGTVGSALEGLAGALSSAAGRGEVLREGELVLLDRLVLEAFGEDGGLAVRLGRAKAFRRRGRGGL